MEEIGELIGKGFVTWKDNLILCLPFLLSFIVSMLVFIPFLAAFAVGLAPLASLNATSLNAASANDIQDMVSRMDEAISSMGMQQIALAMLLFLAMMLLLSLVSAFFTAGAIGMARQALETRKSDASSMWAAGKKHFLNLFFATILMGLMTLAGLVLLLPGAFLLPRTLPPEAGALGPLLAGIILFILYALTLSLMLALAPYALVLENLGAVSAIRASLDFFRYNKFDVLVLWLVVLALSLGLQMISTTFSASGGGAYPSLSLVTGLVSMLVLSPLSNLWWTRLYMNRKGILLVDEVKDPW
ncbi:Uncharacterised protein [uncultured archaeon]|nr:Uncharacterised protein [uncultured archaeon]